MTPQLKQPDPSAAAEIQGLYGPFTFSEKLLQKIWLRGDFDRSRVTTTDGRRVKIVRAGRWNLLGGPDFLEATVRVDSGPEQTGDIELHLHAVDWTAHGHSHDHAYDRVMLHVVLFPPAAGHRTIGAGGREIPTVALLPLLHHDLEEYAADEVLEKLSDRPASLVVEKLAARPLVDLAQTLRRHARERWRQKVHFARLRIQRLGWEAACHHTALEILGYRFNRSPMLRLAGVAPLAAWANADPVKLFEAERESWSVQGVRPANHPRRRLEQYTAWVTAQPQWPAKLVECATGLPDLPAEVATALARRQTDLVAWRERFVAVTGGVLGGTRMDTMICDGFLPLLAAHTGADPHGVWFHWFPGDLPPSITRALRALGVFAGRSSPATQGFAQGLLGWMVEEGNG